MGLVRSVFFKNDLLVITTALLRRCVTPVPPQAVSPYLRRDSNKVWIRTNNIGSCTGNSHKNSLFISTMTLLFILHNIVNSVRYR